MSTKTKAVIVVSILGAWIFFLTRKAGAAPPPPGTANLLGQVTDAVTGSALPSALVKVDSRSTTSDNNGNFILTGLVSGSYVVEISKTGYETLVY